MSEGKVFFHRRIVELSTIRIAPLPANARLSRGHWYLHKCGFVFFLATLSLSANATGSCVRGWGEGLGA